ncbi:hypothetical protein F951_02864 [Acinetobacter soli CIP 110264]|nr:hypothetical protein F951_02864 [Acinetobacter soli CIP 110264]
MAHGFAGLRHFKLAAYAQKIAQAGYAVVLFDYRYWGGSTGKPRELVHLKQQIDDWKTVIQYMLASKLIDERRIVLWGTDLSGGYVLSLAAELKHVHAVIAQVPFIDGAESAKLYPLQQLPRALKLSSQDYMGAKVGLAPKTLPVIAEQQLCFLPTSDSRLGYLSIVNPDFYWSGQVPARAFFQLLRFRPIQSVRNISVPVLFIAAKQDSLIPIDSSREAATNIAPFVDYHEWNMQHFDVYHGIWFEKAIATQLEFLHRHIGVS